MNMNEKVKEYLSNYSIEINELFVILRKLVYKSTNHEIEETLWAKIPSYYVNESFIRIIPFKDHINIEAKSILDNINLLNGYKITPKGMLQLYLKQEVPLDILLKIFSETLN